MIIKIVNNCVDMRLPDLIIREILRHCDQESILHLESIYSDNEIWSMCIEDEIEHIKKLEYPIEVCMKN